jgi:hypothetical protein
MLADLPQDKKLRYELNLVIGGFQSWLARFREKIVCLCRESKTVLSSP